MESFYLAGRNISADGTLVGMHGVLFLPGPRRGWPQLSTEMDTVRCAYCSGGSGDIRFFHQGRARENLVL
jgi:hypothetical protein